MASALPTDKYEMELAKIQMWLNWRKAPIKINVNADIVLSIYHEDISDFEQVVRANFPDCGEITITPSLNKYVKWRATIKDLV